MDSAREYAMETTLRGRVGKAGSGQGWVSGNWDRVVIAHAADLSDIDRYFPGTLNVRLDETWLPPEDALHRERSHARGLADGSAYETGADFLTNGNYLHPTIHVVSINELLVEGRLYVPGRPPGRWRGEPDPWKVAASKDAEILARVKLRELLGLGPCDEAEVVLRIVEISGTSSAC